MQVTAKAHANIALVKYWGKREEKLNLPATGSISVTLNSLFTRTTVEFVSDLKNDVFTLNNQMIIGDKASRVTNFLDIIRKKSGLQSRAKIISENNFPTGAGLASSASAFACLALAGSTAAGLSLTRQELSELARMGSGSAARSVFGGFVEMNHGQNQDGSDAVASQIVDEKYWDIRILVLILSREEKQIGSTEGMKHTANTSPFYPAWIQTSADDLAEIRGAVSAKNFTKLGELSEYNCLKMHAVMLSSRPGLIYWNENTLKIIHAIRKLRQQGIEIYFTIDAGPQVKAICQPHNLNKIREYFDSFDGIHEIIETSLGPDAQITRKN